MALLKNCLSLSTMETSATGALNMRVARRVNRSNGSSGALSRSPVRWTAASRFRLRTMANRSDIRANYNPLSLITVLNHSEGLRPSDSPTRSLASRFAGSLRSRGSRRCARSRLPCPAPCRSRGSRRCARSRLLLGPAAVLKPSLATLHDCRDRADDAVEPGGFGGEPLAPGSGDPIEAGATLQIGFPPLGGHVAADQETLQRRIERTLPDLQDVCRHHLEVPGDGVSVRRPTRQRLEDQHFERAGKQFRADGMLVSHVTRLTMHRLTMLCQPQASVRGSRFAVRLSRMRRLAEFTIQGFEDSGFKDSGFRISDKG